MSTENTEYNFSKAMSQVAALRAEEPALAWANDYQQPPAVLARAQQLDEEYGKITEKDIECEVLNAVAQRLLFLALALVPFQVAVAQLSLQLLQPLFFLRAPMFNAVLGRLHRFLRALLFLPLLIQTNNFRHTEL
jgi:hypothetical protein